jgi:hypothetical protein
MVKVRCSIADRNSAQRLVPPLGIAVEPARWVSWRSYDRVTRVLYAFAAVIRLLWFCVERPSPQVSPRFFPRCLQICVDSEAVRQ